jgi:GalNAc-alpha-(1->4)-GalNAc-alpha-(1->3)-diNAcBac-PP-undecaprenol alpha-1,4-N-acetyl-D-galactosaminyltransferase
MKRILFVVHALGYGGVGKMLSYLANYVSKSGYEVVIYAQEQTGQHYEQNKEIKIVQETEFFSNYYTRRFRQIGQLRKRVAEIHPDLVISFQTNQNALSVIATRGRNIPVIISERGDPYQYTNFVAKLKNAVINRAEGAVFQTQKAREYFGKGLQNRSRVIYNPSTVTRIDPPTWEERRNEIVFVARFDIQQKRQDLMVDAFSMIASQYPEYKLHFYGIGNDEAVIREKVEKIGLTDRVIFGGLEKNIPEAIRTAKLFVLTSDYEGMPNALIEAMSVGLPCVSTDCSPGGAAELIDSGVNGIIVPVGDPEAIADGMRRMLDNPNMAENMGLKAQEITELLNPDLIYGQWLEYIEEVLNRKK